MFRSFEDVWTWIAIFVVLCALTLGVVTLCKEKRVDGYYLSRAQASDVATCVFAHWTWHVDEKVYCTNDPKEALDVLTKAQEALRK